MKLISEFNDYAIEPVIVEQNEKGEKDYFIEGVFMQGDIKNRNGRIYPIDVMKKEVGRYVKEFVEKDRAFGELGHPDGPTINLDKVSHMITKLEQDGSNFMGRAKILTTPNGQIVRNLINDGAKLGVSSRGLGSLEQRGGAQVVKDDFQLATAADIVADPSAPNAFVEGIMEGKDWVWNNGSLVEAELERAKRRINERVRKRQANEDTLEFLRFLKKL